MTKKSLNGKMDTLTVGKDWIIPRKTPRKIHLILMLGDITVSIIFICTLGAFWDGHTKRDMV